VCAESVKPLNPDCVVCPVVISYDGSEAKKILGDNAAQQILNLGKIKQKIILLSRLPKKYPNHY
jgi:hypothetical protein